MNDTTPPTVSVSYPVSNQMIINQTNITIYGSASDDESGVKEVFLSINNSPFVLALGTTTRNYTTNLSINTTNLLRVFARDVPLGMFQTIQVLQVPYHSQLRTCHQLE